MSKGLEALENIKKLFFGSPIDLSHQFGIIEKELNETEKEISTYEFLFNEFKYYIEGETFTLADLTKRVKAVEIIKKIGFQETEYITCVDYETYCESRYNNPPISKEEFDLINEVMSYD